MAHYAASMAPIYDPSMLGAQAYLPATLQQQHLAAMQMQQQQQHQQHQQQQQQQAAAAASTAQPHHPPPAAPSSSGGGGGGSKAKDSDKKGRKPYTITKPRESWTKEEHQLFLDALQLYERDWKRIGQHIPTKSIIQIRSHAQKHFIRLTKMGMKEYIPAPSRPKRKQPTKTKGASKSKRQKTGEDEEEGEEEGQEDDEDNSAADAQEGEGADEQMGHATVPASPNSKAARSLHGLASMVKKEGDEGSSARKKASARSGGATRKAPPPMRRAHSLDSAGGGAAEEGADEGAASAATRRSGRQRKQKRKFEDEDYDDGDDIGDEEEQEEPAAARRKTTGKGTLKQPPLEYDDEHAGEYDDGQGHMDEHHDGGSNRQSPYTSQPPSAANSAPSTPLRSGQVLLPNHAVNVGGGINQLSQLSPLSQLSQATEIDISSHMLPASSYNPKLKPYPGLHMRSSAVGPPPMHGAAMARTHPQMAAQAVGGGGGSGSGGGGAVGDESGETEESAAAVQPEFAKVYSFLGSLFDPSTSGHIEELDKMTPVNKDIVQKLMQNLATNLSGAPPQTGVGYPSGSSLPPGLSSDVPLHSLLGSGSSASRLLSAPKHMRTSSLGSIGSLDALSPDLGHRWIGMDQQPSVSPMPAHLPHHSGSAASSFVGASLSSAAGSGSGGAAGGLMAPNLSPSYLPRSFSSEGLTVSVIPPGSTTVASLGLSGVAPPPSSSSTWSTDKSRPGFASSALVSRLTARSALSPLSVAPLSASTSAWANAASSPTAPSYGGYAGYAMGSPTMGTPMSFVGSPGGFFSPSMGAASSSTMGASAAGTTAPASAAEPHIHQYPTIKTENAATGNTLSVPSAARLPPSGSPSNANSAAAAAATAAAAASSAAAASTSAAPASSGAASAAAPAASAAAAAALPPPVSLSPGVVSPSHVGNILASLHSSPVPLAQPLDDPPAAQQTAT